MRRFFLRLMMLSAAFSVVGFGAMWLGRQQPPSDWLDVLRFNECAPPCWIGITPGETHLRDAMTRIETTFADKGRYALRLHPGGSEAWRRYSVQFRDHPLQLAISLESHYDSAARVNKVRRILLHLRPDDGAAYPAVADFMERFEGIREVRAHTGTRSPYLALVSHDRHFYLSVAAQPVCSRGVLDEPVVSILLYAQPPRNRSGWLSEPLRWGGLVKCYVGM